MFPLSARPISSLVGRALAAATSLAPLGSPALRRVFLRVSP